MKKKKKKRKTKKVKKEKILLRIKPHHARVMIKQILFLLYSFQLILEELFLVKLRSIYNTLHQSKSSNFSQQKKKVETFFQ